MVLLSAALSVPSPLPSQTASPPFVTSGHAPSAGLLVCIHSHGCLSLCFCILRRQESLSGLCSVRQLPCESTVLTTCRPMHSSALAFRQEEACISLLTQDTQGRFPHWNVPLLYTQLAMTGQTYPSCISPLLRELIVPSSSPMVFARAILFS